MRNPWKLPRRCNFFPVSKRLKYARHHWLHRVPDFFLSHKAHFKIELVKFAGQTIGTRVFVAKARGYLEVTVEASNHQQLLILLGGLRQRKEFAWMNSAWHKEVARALGAGCGQDWR